MTRGGGWKGDINCKLYSSSNATQYNEIQNIATAPMETAANKPDWTC